MTGVFCTRFFTEGIDGGPESVFERLKGVLGDDRIFCLNQVHSDNIVYAQDVIEGRMPEADGIISANPDDLLCIRTADCLPVLLWSEDLAVHGAVHAGWRGLAKGIVKKAVQEMRNIGGRIIHVAIGPGIGPCCFRVGHEVVDLLGARPLRADGRGSYVDLYEEATLQAIESGVDLNCLHLMQLCTMCCNELFFSYRRDGDAAGRNLSVIGGGSCLLPGLRAG